MRRKDRERDAAFAWEVFTKAPFVTVSMTKPDGTPYAVPLSLALRRTMKIKRLFIRDGKR